MAERTWGGRVHVLTSEGEVVLTGEARLKAIASPAGETWGGTLAADQAAPLDAPGAALTLQVDDFGAKAHVSARMTGIAGGGRSKVRTLYTLEGHGPAPF
jgi:hypothetical protein